LDRGEGAVGEEFVKGHAAGEGGAIEHAGAEDKVVDAVGDHGGHGGDEEGRILVVGVDHDDDVGVAGEGLGVAGLLVGAVAAVGGVDGGVEAEIEGEGDGAVGAAVIDEDDVVDEGGQLADGGFESEGGVIGRQDDRDTFAVDHEAMECFLNPARPLFRGTHRYERGRGGGSCGAAGKAMLNRGGHGPL